MNRLEGKVALVSGAVRGMGRATAELFASEGAQVIGGDLLGPDDSAGSSGVVAGADAKIDWVHLDVTSEESWREVVDNAVATYGHLDILVNNAGICIYDSILDTTKEVWDTIIAVDQYGVFLGMKVTIPAMIDAGGGSIVNFASIWGMVGAPSAAAYHAAKGAVVNMTRNVASAHAKDKIRVNAVLPGYILTPLNADQAPEINAQLIAGTLLHRPGNAIEVAYGVLFLASDEASYITGTQLAIDGGFLAQ